MKVHFKILHNICPTNVYFSKFLDIENKCSFYNDEPEPLMHLYYLWVYLFTFWTQMGNYILCKINHNIEIECTNVSIYFEHNKHDIDFIVNVFIMETFYIHK